MSNYKYPTPQLLLKAICDTIREKTGSNNKIIHQNIPDELDSIIIDEEEYKMAAQELLNVMYGEEMEILDSKYILSIPEKRFYYNNKITTVNLPKCTSIGDMAFHPCKTLTTVNLPKCTYIGDSAFYHCDNLTTVNLPRCTTLGNAVFGFCPNLTTLILNNNQIVNLCDFNYGDLFFGVAPINNINIYVPDGLINNYKTATKWSSYANKIKPISELPSNLKEEYGYD